MTWGAEVEHTWYQETDLILRDGVLGFIREVSLGLETPHHEDREHGGRWTRSRMFLALCFTLQLTVSKQRLLQILQLKKNSFSIDVEYLALRLL